MKKKPLLIYAKGDVYKQEWRKVDSLEQNGLTKSALTEVASIYKKAIEEDNKFLAEQEKSESPENQLNQ